MIACNIETWISVADAFYEEPCVLFAKFVIKDITGHQNNVHILIIYHLDKLRLVPAIIAGMKICYKRNPDGSINLIISADCYVLGNRNFEPEYNCQQDYYYYQYNFLYHVTFSFFAYFCL